MKKKNGNRNTKTVENEPEEIKSPKKLIYFHSFWNIASLCLVSKFFLVVAFQCMFLDHDFFFGKNDGSLQITEHQNESSFEIECEFEKKTLAFANIPVLLCQSNPRKKKIHTHFFFYLVRNKQTQP